LVFAEGCSDSASCYCGRDSDCRDVNPCNRGTCEASEGCRYEGMSCFANVLCLLEGTPTTGGTSAPSSDACTRFRERLMRLSERVRAALAAGEALLPGTAAVHYRSALRRAESAARARVVPDLRLLARTAGSRRPSRRFDCLLQFLETDVLFDTQFEVQVEVLRRLRRLHRDIGVCRMSGG
jgi:hypothetical protein